MLAGSSAVGAVRASHIEPRSRSSGDRPWPPFPRPSQLLGPRGRNGEGAVRTVRRNSSNRRATRQPRRRHLHVHLPPTAPSATGSTPPRCSPRSTPSRATPTSPSSSSAPATSGSAAPTTSHDQRLLRGRRRRWSTRACTSSTPTTRPCWSAPTTARRPVEYVLHALAACLTAGIANIAAARNINLTSVESTVEGDIDLLGILGLGEGVRNGFQGIKVSFKLKGDDPDKLRKVVEQSTARSAVYDIVTNGVPVRSRSRPADQPRSGVGTALRDGVRPDGASPPAPPRAPTTESHHAHDQHVDHRRRPGRPRPQPLPDRRSAVTISCSSAAGSAERWRSERWDSLRLLTPNWMTRLPGYAYDGPRPGRLHDRRRGRRLLRATTPSRSTRRCVEHTAVRRVAADGGDCSSSTTDDGPFLARNVVIATGWCDQAAVPALAANVSTRIHQVVPSRLPTPGRPPRRRRARRRRLGDRRATRRRAPPQRPAGHVGRRHATAGCRARYRGMDSFWWLDLIGALDRTIDDVDDPRRRPPRAVAAARRLAPTRSTLDLATLQAIGVRLVGRLQRDRRRARHVRTRRRRHRRRRRPPHATASSTASTTPSTGSALSAEVLDPDRPARRGADLRRIDSLDLARGRHHIVVWATGYRRPYDWLELPILDQHGEIRQYRGVTPMPGAYVLGQRFQHYRNSNFIDGVGRDARVRRRAHLHRLTPLAASCSIRIHSPDTEHESAHDTSLDHPALRSGAAYDVIVVGGRAAGAATAMLLARSGLRHARPRARRLRSRHALDPRPDARRRAAAVAMGPARRDRRRRHAARAAHHVHVRRRAGRDRHQAVARRRRPVRAAPDGARSRRSCGPPPMPALESTTARPSTDLLWRGDRVVGVRATTDGRSQRRAVRPAGDRRRRHPLDRRPPRRRRAFTRVGRARRRGPRTATGPTSRRTATSGCSAPTPAPA